MRRKGALRYSGHIISRTDRRLLGELVEGEVALVTGEKQAVREHKEFRAEELEVSEASEYMLLDLVVLKDVDLSVVGGADDDLRREPH